MNRLSVEMERATDLEWHGAIVSLSCVSQACAGIQPSFALQITQVKLLRY